MSEATPGLRLHPRTMPVQRASADLGLYLIEFQQEHGLTGIEMSMMLIDKARDVLKYELRAERHPDDPSQKADEE